MNLPELFTWTGRISWIIIALYGWFTIARVIRYWRATHQARTAQRHLPESELKGN